MANQDFDILAKQIERINSELEKSTGQIGRFESKIQGLKRTISEGGLGTFQIQELNSQIDALAGKIGQVQEKMASLQSTKSRAIDINKEAERQKILDAQAKTFGEVAKAVDTLERKINKLSQQKSTLSGSFTDFRIAKQIEDDIAKAEAAIKAFQARLSRYTPQGLLKTSQGEAETADALRSTGRLEGVTSITNNQRQNLLLKDAITLREIASATEKVTENANAANKAFQDERTQGVINRKKEAIVSLATTIENLQRVELTEGSGMAARLQTAIGLYKQLTAEVAQLTTQLNQQGAAQDRFAGARTNIPGGKPDPYGASRPSGDNPKDFMHWFFGEDDASNRGFTGVNKAVPRKYQQFGLFDPAPPLNEAERKISQAEFEQEALLTKNTPAGNPWGIWEKQAVEKKLVNAVSKSVEAETKRVQGLQDVISADKRYAQALKIAEQQGFGIGDLKNIRTRGTGGINQLQFQREDDLGIKRNLDIYSTPSGRATAGISNQFRTFGQGVVRDIGELTKWSIALAAVYGPLQKVQELVQEMIQNQTKLAEATITVNSAFTGQAEIFAISAEAANASGEAITGVIDAFTQAYRATGGQGDQVTRLATAQKLLSDALTLSKLSTLDQAGAIDTLSAAVRQSGQGFNYTTTLLDKWVRVTKVANVDLATLATGFATVADAADTAGLATDDLNGILATLAESTNQSGQEVANTSRAIISGFQSDQGVKALEALGIATKDAEGNMRSLKDVIQEIAALRNSKIIDDTQFSKLTLAIGGGTRRQAAVATFLENYDRALAVASESSRAQGDAAAALDKQLATVQTSITKLANSFTTLAQTLGTEGGFLSIIQASVDTMGDLVGMFNDLLGILGKATPALVAFIAASVALKYRGIPSIQAALGGAIATTPQPGIGTGGGGWQGYLPGINGKPSPEQKLGDYASKNLLGTNLSSGIVQGILLSAVPALMNATNKEDRYGSTKAVADITGGLVGGIIGSFTVAGPLVGATIGTAIAEAFVNSTIARKTDIFGYNTPATFGEPTKRDITTEEGRNKALEEARAGLYASVGGGSEAVGKFITSGSEKAAKSLIDNINDAIKNQDKGQLESILNPNTLSGNRAILRELGITPDQVRGAFAGGSELTATPESTTYRKASPEAQKAYDAVFAAIKAVDEAKAEVQTPFTKEVFANKIRFGTDISAIKNQESATLAQQRISGDVTTADYARKTTAIGGFDTKALQYYTALGEEFKKLNEYVDTDAEAFDALSTIIIEGAENSIPELTGIVGEIEDLTNILKDPTLKDTDLLESLTGFKSLDEVERRLKELQTTGANILSDIYGQAQQNEIKIPNIVGDISKPLTTEENKQVEQRTQQLQGEFYQGFLDFSDSAYEGLKETFEDFAVTIKDSGDEFYKSVTETDQQFRQAALKQLEEEGKIRSQKENPFGIQQLDITSQQGAGLQGKIDYYSQYLSQEFPQYKQNPEDVGVIFSDYITDVLHGDNLAIKLALEKIVDLNQKQLDGMYNIPEGATFWVPLTAAYYKPKNEGQGGINMPEVKGIEDNTSATALNTQALMNMTDKWNNADPFLFKRPPEPHEDRYDKMNRVTEPITKFAPGGLANPMPRYVTNRDDRYDKMQTAPETKSFTEQLMDGLRNFFQSIQEFNKNQGLGTPVGGTARGGLTASTPAAPTVQARMDLRFENSTQLIVDGRVLASIITPYLSSDLIKFEASQGTITKRYVI